MKIENITLAIGNTPHLRANRLFSSYSGEVWIKLERQNPGGSIKDRIALFMLEEAEKRGDLKKGMTIVEPTSGNTGIGLAMICAVKGYKLKLVMPESMSLERRRVMAAYGATFELTPKEKGTLGAVDRAKAIAASSSDFWMPNQFENRDNLKAHAETTAEEILKDFPEGIEALITGVGTGGHITAVGEILKEKFGTKIIAVEPSDSPVLSGGKPGAHPLQGIGTGFVPGIINQALFDEIITINKEEAFHMAREAARKEALFVGISSGAALAAVSKYLPKASGGRLLSFCYDTGERYLSVAGLFDDNP